MIFPLLELIFRKMFYSFFPTFLSPLHLFLIKLIHMIFYIFFSLYQPFVFFFVLLPLFLLFLCSLHNPCPFINYNLYFNLINYNMTIQTSEENFLKNNTNFSIEKESKVLKFFKILTFHLAGVTCLIAYNALLSGLDCFIYYYEEFYPQILFPNLYFFFNFFFQIFFMLQSIKYSHYILIQACLLVTTATLFLNPIVMVNFSKISSFIITCVLTALQGFTNAMLFNLFYSLMMHLDGVYITATIAGHSLSGILMNLTRLSTLFIFNLEGKRANINKSNLDNSFFTFYYMAGGVIMANFFMMIFMRRQKDFKMALRKACPSDELFDEEVNNDERCLSLCSDPYKESIEEVGVAPFSNQFKLSEYEKLKIICNKLPGLNFFIFVHSVITFCLYPGVLIAKNIFSENAGFSIVIVLIIFNSSDMLSREATRFFYIENSRTIFIVISVRLSFVLLFPVVYIYLAGTNFANFFCNGWVFSILIVFLGASNGFIISNSFSYIHNTELIHNNLKSKASLLLSAFLNFGCFVGTLLSYILLIGSQKCYGNNLCYIFLF